MSLALLRAGLTSVLLAVLLAAMPAAHAHAQLRFTDPADNAVLTAPPNAIRLMFNEPVSALRVDLIGPDGASTSLLDGTDSGETVSITLPGGMREGTHVLSWRVASTDGHPIAGSLVFSIGTVTGGAANAPTPIDRPLAIALWAGKVALFLGLFFGVGGAAFSVTTPLPAAARRLSLAASLLGLVAAPLTLALQGLDVLGLSLADLLTPAAWHGGFATSYGATATGAALALGLAILSLALSASRVACGLAGLALLLAALAISLSGHASAASPQWLTRPAVFLHLAGILAWTGALPSLWFLLRQQSEAAFAALAGFSRWIIYAVASLTLSGLVLAGVQLGWPGPNWLAPYSAILAVKLGLLLALFGLAGWNRLVLTAPVLAGSATARYRLRQSIRAEIVIVILIAALVAFWRFTPPPRALEPASLAGEPAYLHMMDASIMATLNVVPAQTGPVSMAIATTDFEGNPLAVQAVNVALSEPARDIAPIRRDAMAAGDHWQVDDFTIPVPGTWTVTLEIRVDRFTLVTLQGALDIPK